MAVERTGFEILMNADASGVVKAGKESAAALGETAGATKDLSGKMEEAKGKLDEGTESFHVLGKGAHETHSALRALDEVVPGVGRLAHSLFNLTTASIGLAVIGFNVVKGAISDFMHALDELDVKVQRGKWAEKIKEQAEQSAVAFEVWKNHVDRIISAEQTLQEVTARNLAQSRDRLSAENDIGRAQSELDKARLALAERLGQVTPEQAVRIRLEIDQADFKRSLDAKVKEAEAEVAAKTGELNQAQGLQFARGADVDTTKRAADSAAASKTRNDKELDQSREHYKALQDEAAANQKWLDDFEASSLANRLIHQAEADRRFADQQEMPRRIAQAQNLVKQEEAKKPRLDAAAETSKAAFEAAKERDEENQKTVKDLTLAISQKNEDLAALRTRNAALESIHNQTAQTTAAAREPDALHAEAAMTIQNAETERRASQGVHPGTTSARQHIRALLDLVKDLTKNQAEFQEQGMVDDAGLAGEIALLKQEVTWLKLSSSVNRQQ
jgi:hypothetical protein